MTPVRHPQSSERGHRYRVPARRGSQGGSLHKIHTAGVQEVFGVHPADGRPVPRLVVVDDSTALPTDGQLRVTLVGRRRQTSVCPQSQSCQPVLTVTMT